MSGRDWAQSAVRALVRLHTNQLRWKFLYIGADQDAIEIGARPGSDACSPRPTTRASLGAMAAASVDIRRYRHAKTVNPQPS
ncbi:hypothetical protein ABH922_005422 [Rhodococcus sp. 27YEA15]